MRYIICVLEIYCIDKDISFINISHPVNQKPKTTNKLSALLLWTNYVYFSGKSLMPNNWHTHKRKKWIYKEITFSK